MQLGSPSDDFSECDVAARLQRQEVGAHQLQFAHRPCRRGTVAHFEGFKMPASTKLEWTTRRQVSPRRRRAWRHRRAGCISPGHALGYRTISRQPVSGGRGEVERCRSANRPIIASPSEACWKRDPSDRSCRVISGGAYRAAPHIRRRHPGRSCCLPDCAAMATAAGAAHTPRPCTPAR